MPRISDQIRESVFYVYPSVAAAERGEGAGGSGFFMSVPSTKVPDSGYIYGITNAHVVRRCGDSPVVRLNSMDGQAISLVSRAEHWVFHPAQDDLAAAPLSVPKEVQAKWIPVGACISPDVIAEHDIGPGDDVYMVGRYVDHGGRQRNWPSVRFGNLSMMNWEPIRLESGLLQEAFLVECRSVGGFSGSPVFVWIPPMAARPGVKAIYASGFGPWLLGVDCGHLDATHPVVDLGGKFHPEGWRARASSGMAVVVPAWKVVELLNDPVFINRRAQIEAELPEQASSTEPGAGGA